MCTVKDLKLFFASEGMTVGQARSLIYKMLENLDNYRDEDLPLIENRNNYKGQGLVFHIEKRQEKKEMNNALSPRAIRRN